MNMIRQILYVGLILTGMGCALLVPQETRYLQSAQDRATQDEIRQRLGEPRHTASIPEGGTVWIYEVLDLEPGSQSTWSTTGSRCDEYTLIFDTHGILRHWTNTWQRHGGEMMPTYCVSHPSRAVP
jgi:hypothetical protein